MVEYLGRCHCGNLSVRYQTALAPSAWSIRACQCSFCRSHGAVSTSDPAGQIEFRAASPEKLQRYRFGSRTADAILCRECGVYLGVQMSTDAGRFAVLNVNALRPRPAALAQAETVDYEGESATTRQARRAARWTPVAPGSL